MFLQNTSQCPGYVCQGVGKGSIEIKNGPTTKSIFVRLHQRVWMIQRRRNKDEPVIAAGFDRSNISNKVGATSARMPSAIWWSLESGAT